MLELPEEVSIDLFSTCPQSIDSEPERYVARVIEVAKWSESFGYKGILVYTDNGLVDPWSVAQVILENTGELCPLVAVQPVYMHPYAVAKRLATMGFLYNRRMYVNMVAGGFRNDLAALDDRTEHDLRYDRLTEYTLIIRKLLEGRGPVTFDGDFYRVTGLAMTPSLGGDLFPGIFVSGSSEAGRAAAAAMGATAVMYPTPAEQYGSGDELDSNCGVRVGVIARESAAEAWRVAHDRFPPDRRGQLTHKLAMRLSDSEWHRELSHLAKTSAAENSPYWMLPFKNYKTFCPYLVGAYDVVAQELAGYMAHGLRTFILDIPPCEEDLRYTEIVFCQARERVLTTLKASA